MFSGGVVIALALVGCIVVDDVCGLDLIFQFCGISRWRRSLIFGVCIGLVRFPL